MATTTSPHATCTDMVARLLCRVRAGVRQRRDRAQLEALSAYELRDIGLSHADALPPRAGCGSASPRTTAFDVSMQDARRLLGQGDTTGALTRLQRAHVLGQRDAWRHLSVHLAMLRAAWAARDVREAAGQLWRLALLPLGHLIGRLPEGNPGTADVGAFARRPIDPELQVLLADLA